MESMSLTPTAIHGLNFYPKRVISSPSGSLRHMLRADADHFDGSFGEVYFSHVKPGNIRAWKFHRQMTQRFTVPVGAVSFVFFDNRDDSPTKDQLVSLTLDQEEHYGLLIVPPRLWYGFRCLSANEAMIVNCSSLPHDPEEAINIPLAEGDFIPYQWQ